MGRGFQQEAAQVDLAGFEGGQVVPGCRGDDVLASGLVVVFMHYGVALSGFVFGFKDELAVVVEYRFSECNVHGITWQFATAPTIRGAG